MTPRGGPTLDFSLYQINISFNFDLTPYIEGE